MYTLYREIILIPDLETESDNIKEIKRNCFVFTTGMPYYNVEKLIFPKEILLPFMQHSKTSEKFSIR
jgi:hypothetical protein